VVSTKPLTSAGPKNRPRAPDTPPGDIRPEGISKWLADAPEFELLLDMAVHGADLRHTSPPTYGRAENLVLPHHEDEIARQLANELAKGWLTTQPPTGDARRTRNAPIFAKDEPGKVRRLTDYSDRDHLGRMRGANAVVDKQTLGEAPMDRPLQLARAVVQLKQNTGRTPVLLVRDISKAYRRIAVRHADVPHLHTVWRGTHMWDTRLPFGHAAAAHHCCKLTSAIARALTQRMAGKAVALAYVDDFIVVADPTHAAEAERLLMAMLDDIGMPITPEKAAASGTWSTVAQWIGYAHDSERETHSLSPDKVPQLQRLIDDALGAHRLPKARLTTLVGKLNHVANVHHPARAHMQALHRAAAGNTHNAAIGQQAHEDLVWWKQALKWMPAEAKMSRPPTGNSKCIATDASLSGLGCVLHKTRGNSRRSAKPIAALAAPFVQRAEPKHMMTLEAIAVLVAISEWGRRLSGSTVWLQLDNQALVFAMQRGRSKCPDANAVLQQIFTLMIRFQLQICPFHVMSEDNSQADDLSRLWEPCPSTSALHQNGLTHASAQQLNTYSSKMFRHTKQLPATGQASQLQPACLRMTRCTPARHCRLHSAGT